MFRLTVLLLVFCSCEFIAAHDGITTLKHQKSCGCGQPFGSELVQFVTKQNYFLDGLFWDKIQEQMLFLGRDTGCFLRYSEHNGATIIKHPKELDNRQLASIYPIKKKYNDFVIFANSSAYRLTLKNNNYTIQKIMSIDTGDNQILSRSTVCPVGGVIIGTKPKNCMDPNYPKGTAKWLYVNLDKKTTKTLCTGYDITTGVALNKYNDKLYTVDFGKQQIYRYKINSSNNDISLYDKKVIFDMAFHNKTIRGKINAITMDKEGNLYISMMYSNQALVFDTHHKVILRKIPLPISFSTDIKWGGNKRSTLFIASSRKHINIGKEPAAGRLLAISGLGPRGVKVSRVNMP